MKLVTHLVLADLARFRWLLAAYIIVVVGSTAIDAARPLIDLRGGGQSTWNLASTLLWLASHLLTVVLVVLVVQADPLVGSDAFWMTRPIAPGLLLAAKIVPLFLLVVGVPAVAEMAFMTLYRVSPVELIRAALQLTLVLTVWMVLLMSGASITRSVSGFALLCGGVIMAIAASLAMAMAVSASQDDGAVLVSVTQTTGAEAPIPPHLEDPTPVLVLAILTIATGVGFLAVQYTQRLRRRSGAVGAAGIALACAVASVWPLPIFRPRVTVPEWARDNTALRLHLDRSSVSFDREGPPGFDQRNRRHARALVTLGGVAPGWHATLRYAGAKLEPGSGSVIQGIAPGYSAQVPFHSTDDLPARVVLRGVLDVDRIGGLGQHFPERTVLMVLREGEFQANRGATGGYTGFFFIDLRREELVASLALARTAGYRDGADQVLVEDVRLDDRGVSIRIRRSSVDTGFDRRPPVWYSFYLRNQSRREACATSVRPADTGSHLPLLPFYGFFGAISHDRRSSGLLVRDELIDRSRLPHSDQVQIDEAWLRGAELVIVRTTMEGSIMRTLEIADFPLQTAAN